MESSGEEEWERKISEKDFRRLSACNSSGDLSVDLKSPIIKALPIKSPPKIDFEIEEDSKYNKNVADNQTLIARMSPLELRRRKSSDSNIINNLPVTPVHHLSTKSRSFTTQPKIDVENIVSSEGLHGYLNYSLLLHSQTEFVTYFSTLDSIIQLFPLYLESSFCFDFRCDLISSMSEAKYLLPPSGLTRYCYNNYRKGIAKVNKNSLLKHSSYDAKYDLLNYPDYTSLYIPIVYLKQPIGIWRIVIATDFSSSDISILKSIGEHIALSFHNLLINNVNMLIQKSLLTNPLDSAATLCTSLKMYLNLSGCTISIIRNNCIYLLTRSSQVYECDSEIFECDSYNKQDVIYSVNGIPKRYMKSTNPGLVDIPKTYMMALPVQYPGRFTIILTLWNYDGCEIERNFDTTFKAITKLMHTVLSNYIQ